jgi:predicted transcriptional regulator
VGARCWSFLKIEETVRTRSSSLTLTPLELDIMKAVWRRHPITVKDVQVAIRHARPLAYTTVMTVMYRLYLKGFLQRTLKSKAHYYEPAVEFSDVRDAAVSGVIDHFFRGSRDEFLEFLGNADDAPPSEVRSPASLDETLL